jgi:hypothetical protein
MYTKELGSYSTKTADSEETKELGSKKNIKIFPPNYQLFIKAAKKLLYKEAKSLFLSFYQLATLEFLKSEDKTEHTSIRYWFRVLFLRKRAWEYRGYGLIGLATLSIATIVYWRVAVEMGTYAFMLHPLIGIICAGGAAIPLCGLVALLPIFIWPKLILRLLFGDVNPGDVARSIDKGTWKKNYNSKYESVLAFLVFDPIGKLANDFPYHNSGSSYWGHYSDRVSHDTIENRWITSEFDPRIEWRLLSGNRRGCVEHRYLPDEEVAKVQKDILLEREEEK